MASYRFLIVRLSAVGDVIRTLPAVKTLKEHYPDSRITWIVEEPSMTLLQSQPFIDEVILFPRRRWSEGIRSMRGAWGVSKEIKRFVSGLRKKRFDVAFDFHGILKSGLLSFFSGASRRIGYHWRSVKEGNFLFSNVKVQLPREKVSRYDRNFLLLRGIGLEVKTNSCPLHIPSADRESIDLFFRGVTPFLSGPLIAIHPGTSAKAAFKQWPVECYAGLGDRLVQELGASVIFTWGEGEKEKIEEIRSRMKASSLIAPQTETLTQLGEIFRRSDLYIGGDTGPTHIASLVNTPAVVIFGPTDPVVNEPVGKHVKIRKGVGCNPCRKRDCQDLRCLKAITVDDVFKGVQEILALKQ